jgi:hypothetical protein
MSAGARPIGPLPTATYNPRAAYATANTTGVAVAGSVSSLLPIPGVVSLIGSYIDFIGEETTNAGAFTLKKVTDARDYALELFRVFGAPSTTFNPFDVQLSTRTTLPSQREVDLYRIHADLFKGPTDPSKLKHPWLVNAQVLERVFQTITAMRVPPPTLERFVDYLKTFVGLQYMYIKESNKFIVEFSLEQPIGVEVEQYNLINILTICLSHYRDLTLCVLLSCPVSEFSARSIYTFNYLETDLPIARERGFEDIQQFSRKYPNIALPLEETFFNQSRGFGARRGGSGHYWVAFELWPHENCLTLRGTYARARSLNSQPFVEAILKSGVRLSQEDLNCALAFACTRPNSVDLVYITTLVQRGANLNYTTQPVPLLFHVLARYATTTRNQITDWKQQATGAKTPRPYKPGPVKADEYVALTPGFFWVEDGKRAPMTESEAEIVAAKAGTSCERGLPVGFVTQFPFDQLVTQFPFDQLIELGADPNVTDRYGCNLIELIAYKTVFSGKRTFVASNVIASIMHSAKTHPPLPKLALSMYIYFRELLTPDYLKSLEGNLRKGIQSDDFQRALDLVLSIYKTGDKIALVNTLDLIKRYGANSTEKIKLSLFKAYCKDCHGPAEQEMVLFLKEQGIVLSDLTDTMLDFYLVELSSILTTENPEKVLIDMLAALKGCNFPFTSEQFLQKLLARASSEETCFEHLINWLQNALDAVQKSAASTAEGSATAAAPSSK